MGPADLKNSEHANVLTLCLTYHLILTHNSTMYDLSSIIICVASEGYKPFPPSNTYTPHTTIAFTTSINNNRSLQCIGR